MDAETNGDGSTSVTLQELLIMLGAKEVEIQKQRAKVEEIVAKSDAEIKALRVECARLRTEAATKAVVAEVIAPAA